MNTSQSEALVLRHHQAHDELMGRTSPADDPFDGNEQYQECIHARGHENVQSMHGSTLEVTTDDWLTPGGDCIIGVEADRAPADFSTTFMTACRDAKAEIRASFDVGDLQEIVVGRGHPNLTFGSERSAVLRTSGYVDDRTIMVEADRAAGDLDRDFVDIVSRGSALHVTLYVVRERSGGEER